MGVVSEDTKRISNESTNRQPPPKWKGKSVCQRAARLVIGDVLHRKVQIIRIRKPPHARREHCCLFVTVSYLGVESIHIAGAEYDSVCR